MPDVYDEDHWYSHSGWPRLRDQTAKLARSMIEDLQEQLSRTDQTLKESAEGFVSDLVIAIGEIVERQVSRELAVLAGENDVSISSRMWSFALRLFANTDALVTAIADDARLMISSQTPNLTPGQVLGRIVKDFLENARRDIVGGSVHRQKTWEAIDRVSRRIASENIGVVRGHRCSDEHILAVFEALRARYPTSHNLPIRNLDKLAEFFDEFCPDCSDRHENEYADALMALQEDTEVWPTMDLCLEKLRSDRQDAWEALAVKVGLLEVSGVTQTSYLMTTRITRARFEALVSEAQKLMQACFENSIAFQMQRLQQS